MGLDIYFIKEKKRNPEQSEELAYFRKVNCLVGFFEEFGMDIESPSFEIDEDMCLELLGRCTAILHNKELADLYLPTTSGFFFGSLNYDSLYYKNLEEIQDALESSILPAFDTLEDDECVIFYISY